MLSERPLSYQKIEAIPGLEDLIEALTNALNACELNNIRNEPSLILSIAPIDVYTILAPYLTVSITAYAPDRLPSKQCTSLSCNK